MKHSQGITVTYCHTGKVKDEISVGIQTSLFKISVKTCTSTTAHPRTEKYTYVSVTSALLFAKAQPINTGLRKWVLPKTKLCTKKDGSARYIDSFLYVLFLVVSP